MAVPQDDLSRTGQPVHESAACTHTVYFHAGTYDAATVAAFLAPSLQGDGAGVIVATRAHGDAIVAALTATGVDVSAAAASGRLLQLDAEQVLGEVWSRGPLPTLAGLRDRIGADLAALEARFADVLAYGEMVDLLVARGRADAALALEGAWGELLAGTRVRLLCGYDLASFDDMADAEAFRAVCSAHQEIHGGPARRDEPLVAELQWKTRQALLAADRLARLQTVTAALGDALTTEEVARVVDEVVTMASGAPEVVVALADATGSLRCIGSDAAVAPEELSSLLAATCQHGEACWRDSASGVAAVGCLPLTVARRRLGAIVFRFADERRFTASPRALLEDIAGQVATALERAALHESVAAARQAAEQASRAKDEFLAMLGHELRNPLSPIVTSLHLMKLRDTAGHLERERAVIERQVENLRRFVEDLLDVSRITRGKLQLERRPVDLAETVALAIEQTAPLLEQRAQLLTVDVPPEIILEADPARLAQVVSNLLLNAVKYTPNEGHIDVRAQVEAERVTLRVRDDGMGIPPELLPTIFDSFVQGPRAADRGQGGLGLGLSIVRSLVAMHGGTVRAASAGLGRGAEFTVELPLARTPRWRRLPDAAEEPAPSNGHGLRVLVVDDNVDAAQSMGELLRTLGCEIRLAHDGPSALLAAQELLPQLVLLDIGLPVMDGYEVAVRLRELPAVAPARLVAVTGYGQAADRERSLRAGFDEHLVKPLHPVRLGDLLQGLTPAPRPPAVH